MNEKRTCNGLDTWEIEAWILSLGSFPIKRHYHGVGDENYNMDRAHVLELENGKWAVVTEEGCSCYSSEEAEVEVFPYRLMAEAHFQVWLNGDKNRKSYNE